jgi:hypothetical protein
MWARIKWPGIAAFRTVSTNYNLWSGWDLYNYICDGIFLGSIPIKYAMMAPSANNLHEEIIQFVQVKNPDLPLKLVVSVLTKSELKGEGFGGLWMVSRSDWSKKGVAHHLLQMEDGTAIVDNQKAIETIFLIGDVLKNGGSVYIHCKAGQSRSVMMCFLTLITFGTDRKNQMPMDSEAAKKLIGMQRLPMHFDPEKVIKAGEIYEEIQALLTRQKDLALRTKFPSHILDIIDGYSGREKNSPDVPMPSLSPTGHSR